MGFYEDRILPHLVDRALGSPPFEKARARVCSGLSGEVIEVGFGSGRNVPHYPTGIERVRAVDPATRARDIAEPRVEASPVPVEYIGLDGAHLPVEDESVDHVLVTWSLCTIPDAAGALAEIRRVLRPGGTLHFVEHGRSPDPRTSRWQSRITPVWRHFAGGCRLDRPIDELISAAGLDISELRNYTIQGPSIATYMYEGTATKR